MLFGFVAVIVMAAAFMVLERVFPDQKLKPVKYWWPRVFALNLGQLGVAFLGSITWDRWITDARAFHMDRYLATWQQALLAWLVNETVFYIWHRCRHKYVFLWRWFHQLHHSPSRIETITSFYKDPRECCINSLITSATNYVLCGISVEAGAYVIMLQAFAEFFYHMNIRTPWWLGFIIQRPEMHRLHHELHMHDCNYGSLTFCDWLGGTLYNPRDEDDYVIKSYVQPGQWRIKQSKEQQDARHTLANLHCGFVPEHEQAFGQLLKGDLLEDGPRTYLSRKEVFVVGHLPLTVACLYATNGTAVIDTTDTTDSTADSASKKSM